ncbi:MAG: hypothetical protein HOV80_26735 [Polyangiaceae bacterium]|nr:hypothetical protein [Polyangiaceae bacterium]
MTSRSGQKSGHAGFGWAEYLDELVREHGSLTAVALKIALASRDGADVATVERGLRRLRKITGEGGSYGRVVLRRFGLPRPILKRARWMGLYHSRFADLPISFCLDQLRLWDRPPVAESPVRAYLALGFAHCAIRTRDLEDAKRNLDVAERATKDDPVAACEGLLARAYVKANDGDVPGAKEMLARAKGLARGIDTAEDAPCFRARALDQLAYLAMRTEAPDVKAAKKLYERIDEVGPPFALCKRFNGLGYVAWRAGDRETAAVHARLAVTTAGDAGLLRQRAISLSLLARVADGDEAIAAGARARDLAAAIEDLDLLARLNGASAAPPARDRKRPPRRKP